MLRKEQTQRKKKKKSTNATMIVVTDHISCSVLVLPHPVDSTQCRQLF